MATQRNEVVTVLTVDARQAQQAAKDYADALDKVATKTGTADGAIGKYETTLDRSAKVSRRAANELEAMLRGFDPLYAASQKLAGAQEKLAGAVDTVDAQFRQGIITAEQRAERMGLLATKSQELAAISGQLARGIITHDEAMTRAGGVMNVYGRAITDVHGKSSRFNAVLGQAGFQIADVASQISMGQNAFAAMGMQLGQLLGAFGTAGAVIGGVVTVAGVLAGKFGESATEAQKASIAAETYKNSLQELVGLEKKYNDALRERQGLPTGVDSSSAEQRLREAEGRLAALQQKKPSATDGLLDHYLSKLSFGLYSPDKPAIQQAQGELGAARAGIASANDYGDATDREQTLKGAYDFAPGYRDLQKLTRQRADIVDAVQGASAEGNAEKLQRLTTLYGAVNQAISTYATEGEKARLTTEAQAKASAMSAAEGARYLATRQAEIAMMGQVIDPAEREAKIRAASLGTLIQWNAATQNRIRTLAEETEAQQNLNAAIGRGYEARTRAQIENQIADAKRQNPAMSGAQESALRNNLSRNAETKRAGDEGNYLDNLDRQAANENRLADARLRGAEALRQEQIAADAINRVYQSGGSEEEAQKALARLSDTQQRAQFYQQAQAMEPKLAYEAQIEALNRLKESQEGAMVSDQAYSTAFTEARLRMLESSNTWSDGVQAGLERYAQTAQQTGTAAATGVANGMNAITNSLTGLVTGTMSASGAFKNMASSIINDLVRMQIQSRITAPMSSALSGLIGSFFGNSGTQVYSSTADVGPHLSEFHASAGAATGGLVSAGSVRGYAGGGLITGPGTGTSDSIMAMVNGGGAIRVSNGESINTAEATAKYLPMIQAMNKGTLPKFADGGVIGSLPRAMQASSGAGDGATPVKVSITNINNTDSQVTTTQRRNADGGLDIENIVDKALAKKLGNRNSGSSKSLRQNFGARETLVGR